MFCGHHITLHRPLPLSKWKKADKKQVEKNKIMPMRCMYKITCVCKGYKELEERE
jgi:hypothetical protein